MRETAFYLKVNRIEDFAIKNLSRWIDASYLMDADCYIICDNEDLKKKILKSLLIYSEIYFMESETNADLKYIVDHIANRNWKNAAYAHLTSFWDAKKRNYKYFWNVDADDTRMCVSIDRMVEILKTAEDFAKKEKIGCFSLDMWRSETHGKHWSFGVTFVDNQIDWLTLCKNKCIEQQYQEMDNEGNQNVDWFFTYLKNCNAQKIETFYVENMRFLHYSQDFIEKPIASGMYHWTNGKLIYPFLYYGFGIREIGMFDIASDVVRLDVGIEDEEAQMSLTYSAREGKDLSDYYRVEQLINSQVCQKKSEVFMKKHGFNEISAPEIICFGAGNALEKNLNKIRKLCDLKYVCDNDENKWGKEIVEGVTCISPGQLSGKKNVMVIILVYSRNCVNQIADQLEKMNIKYDLMENWFACVE